MAGERWRTERWDSLVFQFPNWSLQLPGYAYQGTDPNGYASKDEFIRFLETYASVIITEPHRLVRLTAARDQVGEQA